MPPGSNTIERRSLRSRQPDLATRHYMLSVTRKHQPRAIVLADLKGRMIAGVEGRPFMETGFLATRADAGRGDALAKAALDDLLVQARAEAAAQDAADFGESPKGPGLLDRVRAWWRTRHRDSTDARTARRANELHVPGGEFLLVVEGDAEVADAAFDEARAGLERILRAA